jgi:hypothetical protein
MSDSLNATVIVSEFGSTIWANAELEPLDEEDPSPPAVALPPAEPDPPEDDELEEELLELLEVELADTGSPGCALESETIVPADGAYSFVLLTVVCAVWTAASAL